MSHKKLTGHEAIADAMSSSYIDPNNKAIKFLCKVGLHRLVQEVDEEGAVDIFCNECGKMYFPSDNYVPGDLPLPKIKWWNELLRAKY